MCLNIKFFTKNYHHHHHQQQQQQQQICRTSKMKNLEGRVVNLLGIPVFQFHTVVLTAGIIVTNSGEIMEEFF
jgi:hypothetical protein